MSFSENAILTKSRAIYASRLTPQNYRELLNCTSVREVALYLSGKTRYAESFAELTSEKMNRMMLESTIKKNLADSYSSLCRFAKILGNEMYMYIVIKNDISEILSVIRYINTPNRYEYLVNMPLFFNRITTLNIRTLALADDFEDILDILKGTPYYDVLKVFAADGSTDMTAVENALNKYLFEFCLKSASKNLKGREKTEVSDYLKMLADIKLIKNLYRLKFNFNVPASEIEKYNFETGVTMIEKNHLALLKESQTKEEFFDAVMKTVYGKKAEKEELADIEKYFSEYLYRYSSKRAVYSTYPNEVMFCCIILAENEIQNITHITEGIKYNLSPEIIAERLVGFGNTKEGDTRWQ